MKKSIICLVVLSSLYAGVANANVGMLSQDPNAPSTNYDDIQDKASQAAAALANSAINQNQQAVAQIKTNIAGIGQNAQAIGQTNAALGQTNQSVQTNANQIQKNWNQQNSSNQVLSHAINNNAANINGLTSQVSTLNQQAGNFVTKPDYDAGQKTQDDAAKAETTRVNGELTKKVDVTVFKADQARQDKALTDATAKQDQINKGQDAKNKAFINKNNSQDAAIALKADQSALDQEKVDRLKGDADNAASIATNAGNISTNANSIATNAGSIVNNRTDINNNATQIGLNTKNITTVNDGMLANKAAIATNTTAISTKAAQADLIKEQQNRLSADSQLATRISGKVDQTVYDAGQAAQDKALNDETTARVDEDKQIHHLLNAEAVNRIKSDDALGKRIDTKVDNSVFTADQKRQDDAAAKAIADQKVVDAAQDKATTTETSRAKAAENSLEARKMDKTTFAQVQQQNASQSAAQGQAIKSNSKAIARNSQRIDRNEREIANNRKLIKQIGNNAAAMSSLHFDANKDSWALSAGTAGDGAAFAAGIQKQVSDHAAVSFQASAGTDGGYMVGVGIHGDY